MNLVGLALTHWGLNLKLLPHLSGANQLIQSYYTCLFSARLVPPSKPQILKISDTSVMVTWTVRENSGLPITFFKVQYRQLDGEGRLRGWRTVDEDIPSNVLQYEVRNLRSTATYKFRIVAVYSNNDNKNGPNSARFRLSTDSANQPRSPTTRPVIVNIEAVAANALKIVWQVRMVGWGLLTLLTHWGQDKMAAIFQRTFSNVFWWMKIHEFPLKFHWSLFIGSN